jgi:hypothetical protein
MKLKEAEKTVKVSKALPLLGLTRHVFDRMMQLGFFTEHRPSLVTDRGRRAVFLDEIREFQRLMKMQLPRTRVLAGMLNYRAEQGRYKK